MAMIQPQILKDRLAALSCMRVWMGGSGIHYSLKKISPLFTSLKFLSYSLKLDQLFITSEKDDKDI